MPLLPGDRQQTFPVSIRQALARAYWSEIGTHSLLFRTGDSTQSSSLIQLRFRFMDFPMKRFSIALALMLAMPMSAWGIDLGFNNIRGRSSCLRSIAYRARCPIAGHEACPDVWIASLRLCRTYMTTDKWAYRAALMDWKFIKFVEDERKQHWECGFSSWVTQLQEEARKKREWDIDFRDNMDAK